MGLMQCCSTAWGSGLAVLKVLLIVAAAGLHAQQSVGFDGDLSILPFESSSASTLDAHVPSQNLELEKSVIDFVGSGILTGRKQPHFRAPKLRAPKLSSAVSVKSRAAKSPVLQFPKSEPSVTPTTVKKMPAVIAEKKISPFRKWIKPGATSAKPVEIESAAPRVARRSRKSIPRQTIPRQKAPKKKNHTPIALEPVTPSLEKYPAPQTEAVESDMSASALPPLTNSQINLRKKIRGVLTHYYNRPLNTRDRSPWELMHAMLAFEAHSKVLQGGPKGKPITAVGWLCFNQACKRRTLMYVNDGGALQVRVGPALQGHRGQLLAMLAQSRISEDYPMLVEGHELKIADLIDMEKRTCYPRTELTFKLIALMHYLDSDAKWMNDQGMEWGFPRLISEELRQPVRGAACGGTHRLSGLTLAYKTREKRGEPVDGQYLKAKKFVARYQNYAYRLQNRDGSFSTEWFRGPGNEKSIDRKLKTTGHILEWLLYAATEKELENWRTTKAANYLATIMSRNRNKDWEAGPLGHAIHALLVYDRMVFSPYDQPGESPIAAKTTTSGRSRR